MAFLSTDWTINYTLKTVTNNDSGTGNNLPSALGNTSKVGPILEFFQWLATEFAATAQMDDDYPIQSDTPTVYQWLNGWTFGHADDYKYLSGGSIEDPVGSGTATADSLWSNLYSIGSQTTGTQLYMIQNDAEVTPWWITGNIDILVLVKDTGSWIQSPNTAGTLTNGGLWIYAREFGDTYDHNFADISAGGRNPIGINTAQDGSNASGELYLSVASATGFAAGNFVEGGTSGAVGRIRSISTNDIYLEAVRGGTFVISETITEYSDRELQTATGQSTTNSGVTAFTNVVAGYTDIKHTQVTDEFTGGTTSGGPFVVGETVTQTGTGATGLFVAEVSDVIHLEYVSGTFNGTGQLTGGTSLATYTPTGTAAETTFTKDLNNGAGAQPYTSVVDCATRPMTEAYEWLKYITRYGSTGSTYSVNGDDGQEYRGANEGTYTEFKTAPFGTLAGTTFYGAQGIWVEDYDTADFVLRDANYSEQTPPNYQKVTATHPSLSGCNILVCEISAGSIVKNQYTVNAVTTTTIQATASININKTPQSGTVRMADDTEYTYTSFSGDTFSGVSPDPTGETGDFYVPLLSVTADATSEVSDNIIFNANFDVRTSVRKYGFKPYDVDTQFTSNGLPFSPILTTDPQAT